MFIAIKHQINDPEAFWGDKGKQFISSLPKEVTLHSSFSNRTGSEALCLWEAESIEKLRSVVDPVTAEISKNEYMEVDPQRSINLPKMRQAA